MVALPQKQKHTNHLLKIDYKYMFIFIFIYELQSVGGYGIPAILTLP